MARWFKEFPINLKNGTDRIGARGNKTSSKNRKNSSTDLCSSQKDGKVWDGLLLAGKGRKNSKGDQVMEPMKTVRSSTTTNAYISRLIRVDTLDKSPNFNPGTITMSHQVVPEAEKHSKTDTVIILEDYADPFDAQKTREQRDSERLGDNDGYMEPYDAQQMITEIRRRGSKDLLKVQMEGSEASAERGQPANLHLYDAAHYEGSGESEKAAVAAVTRPEMDMRPSMEYEPPWEWRKEHIVRTLSAHFDSPECPSKDSHLTSRQHTRQKSWTQKILRTSSSSSPGSSHETLACCVDPTRPLEKQSWYHGCVTRQEAELQLQACKEASFLVRNSESDSTKYSIALKTSQGCVHIMVAQTKEHGYTLDQSSCVFPSISEVVHHYCSQRLPFNGAEHMTLMHPVPRIQ
uniref:SH2 domain-containing adapter protein E-like n=1 Tax=Doryrhamphus excisus TaxID=161450 RepID=UPI0025AEAB1D|nr:SH2 domain-containing adapter protein E-like [Doryrhamphus excisus]